MQEQKEHYRYSGNRGSGHVACRMRRARCAEPAGEIETDDALQSQQNIAEQDRAKAGSEEQPEQSGQSGQIGRAHV